MKTRKILSSLIFVLSIGAVLVQTCPVFGAEPGDLKWFFITSMYPLSDVPGSPAIADDGTIYAGSLNGMFYALNPDGTEKWSFDAQSAVISSPAIADDGTIYVGAAFRIYALRPNGTLKWIFNADCLFLGDPAIAKDGAIYFGSNSSKLYAITPDGEEKWTFPVSEGLHIYDPVIDRNGIIYFGTRRTGTRSSKRAPPPCSRSRGISSSTRPPIRAGSPEIRVMYVGTSAAGRRSWHWTSCPTFWPSTIAGISTSTNPTPKARCTTPSRATFHFHTWKARISGCVSASERPISACGVAGLDRINGVGIYDVHQGVRTGDIVNL